MVQVVCRTGREILSLVRAVAEVVLIPFETQKHATEVVVQITAGHTVQDVTVDRDILDVAVGMVSVLDLLFVICYLCCYLTPQGSSL